MCGRYTIAHSSDEILERFEAIIAEAAGTMSDASTEGGDHPPTSFRANFNVAPTNVVPMILRPKSKDSEQGPRTLEPAKWGLIPFWMKDPKKSKPLINARAETLLDSKTFKRPFTKHRCIIPADSFYEWQRADGKKIPMRILLKSRELFGLAGLWEDWHGPDGQTIRSCSIITVAANKLVESVHDRMPAILPKGMESLWLDNSKFDPEELSNILAPYPEDLMELYPVSSLVNSVRNNSPACIEPSNAASEANDPTGSLVRAGSVATDSSTTKSSTNSST